MTFKEVLAQVLDWLQQDKRLSYRALKRQFALDDHAFEDLKEALLYAHSPVIVDDGRGLVWMGDLDPASAARLASGRMPGPGANQVPAPLATMPPHLADKIRATRAALVGERKHVTVLFADLTASTELIRSLDPEAAQQLLDPAIHHMMDAVHRFEGTVSNVLGDGIMALFGAPIAHEDHALRACYAALAMQAALRRYAAEVRCPQGLELRMRVGLNSGEVVVRTISNDLHMDYSAIGATTHLAARMEQGATPGSSRLTAATLRLVEGLVQVTALGPVPVKGLVEPVEVFELVGTGGLRRRLQAAAARGLTPFVGRQPELEALQQALTQAQTGHGQVVAVVGDAGVGKSRLIHEVVHSHRTRGWQVLESAAVSYGKATPYVPVITLLRRYCHVDDGDDAHTIRVKVTGQVLTLDETLQQTLPALLALLDVVPEDTLWLHLDPPQRRQRTLEALHQVLLRASQVQPLLLVCEDLQWIDTETQALLDHLVESVSTARILLLVNYRPEYRHRWGSKPYYRQLGLEALPPANAESFLVALLGDDPSLVPLTPRLIAHTAGNPFFLEESVRTLVERGVLAGPPGAHRLEHPLQAMPVPATVQGVLAARIDRLAPEDKRLLQTAAVVGMDVPFVLLRAIADVPEATLHRGLAHLQAAEFLYETRLFPAPEYTFTHALTHEVAYSSLLRERRRGLHAHLVGVLEALAPDRVAEQTARLAHHALRGEVWDKAVMYCQQAGARAYARAAFREAVAAFEQALLALGHLPEDGETRGQALELRLVLDSPLMALGEYQRRLALLGEAETLARTLDDRARLGRVLARRAGILRTTGDPDGAMVAGQQALALAVALGDHALQVDVSFYLGLTYLTLGDVGRAAELLRWSVQAADEDPGTPNADARLRSQAWLARTLSVLGAFAEGRRYGEEALRLAIREGRGDTPIIVYGSLGLVYLAQGDLARAIRLLEQGLARCRASGNRSWLRPIMGGLGYAVALHGRLAEGRALLEEALSEDVHTSGLYGHAPRIAWLSEVCRLEGRGEEAWQHARQALDLARQLKERGNEALALHQLGVVQAHAASAEVTQAGAHYRQALALAEALGMGPLQAHCHRGLGTLYAVTEQRAQAQTALSTARTMYQSMDMTFWLPETEAALVQVAGR